MPHLTLTEKPKATTKPWFSRLLRHPSSKETEWVSSGTHTRMLGYLLAMDPHGAVHCKLCFGVCYVDWSLCHSWNLTDLFIVNFLFEVWSGLIIMLQSPPCMSLSFKPCFACEMWTGLYLTVAT